jgi:hypothetical protein
MRLRQFGSQSLCNSHAIACCIQPQPVGSGHQSLFRSKL